MVRGSRDDHRSEQLVGVVDAHLSRAQCRTCKSKKLVFMDSCCKNVVDWHPLLASSSCQMSILTMDL